MNKIFLSTDYNNVMNLRYGIFTTIDTIDKNKRIDEDYIKNNESFQYHIKRVHVADLHLIKNEESLILYCLIETLKHIKYIHENDNIPNWNEESIIFLNDMKIISGMIDDFDRWEKNDWFEWTDKKYYNDSIIINKTLWQYFKCLSKTIYHSIGFLNYNIDLKKF